MENKIIVLYHRPPYEEVFEGGQLSFRENSRPNGILPLLQSFFSSGMSGVWIAASTLAARHAVPRFTEIKLGDKKHCLLKRVPVSLQENEEFYHKTSKAGLWPVLHSLTERFDDTQINWPNFLAINERFARAAAEEATDDSVIWIHDYNLWLAPYYLRKLMPSVKIAFFLHTPFPCADVFSVLPQRSEIIKSLLCCDLLTFAVPRYIENFVASARSLANVTVVAKVRSPLGLSRSGDALSEPEVTSVISYMQKPIQLETSSVGPDCTAIRLLLERQTTQRSIRQLHKVKQGRKLILAVSRLDYIKGIDRLMEAYSCYIDANPAMSGKLWLVIIAVAPADGIRAYDDLSDRVQHLYNQLHDQLQQEHPAPVTYIREAVPFDELVSWYAAADIMWVPSLRDGTNLVCKEFIAVKGSSPGVLLLSEFLGAATEMPEAVLVNPYCKKAMAGKLEEALTMPVREQIKRNSAMSARIRAVDPGLWFSMLDIFEAVTHEEE